MFIVTCRYSRPLMWRYFARELWRTQGGVLICVPLALIVVVWASSNPEQWWFAGFIGGFCLAYLLSLYNTYHDLVKYLVDRQATATLVDRQATATLSDDGLRFQGELVTCDFPWKAISFARKGPEGLILTVRRSPRPIFLPSDALSEEATSFVKRMVLGAGGRTSDGA